MTFHHFKPRVYKTGPGPYWTVKLPGHDPAAYRTWRYAMCIALNWSGDDAGWRWYHNDALPDHP